MSRDGPKGAGGESCCVRQPCRKETPAGEMTRRLRRGRWGCRPEGDSTFFRRERKYQRKHAARRLQRRPAPLRVAGFGLREPNGWMPRIYSGHPIPALRPEQSDHVPWADCPQGLSSTSARCAHPPGKSPLLPVFERGSSQCRAQTSWRANSSYRARSCSPFPPSKWAGLFPSAAYRRSALPQLALGRLKWRCLGCLDADCVASQHRKNGLDFSLQLALSIHK